MQEVCSTSCSASLLVRQRQQQRRVSHSVVAWRQHRQLVASPSRRAQQLSSRRGVVVAMSMGPGSGLNPELRAALDKFVNEHKVVTFIKGTKDFPQCGFSNTVVQIMNEMGVPYETVDVLSNDLIRSGLKEYSQWPTFPQVYIGGEFFGGCDITMEAYQSGELKETLERVMME